MPIISIQMEIDAPTGRCFDLARSIDLHKVSTVHTREEAVGGVTSGLIGLNETVTWKATHFGVGQTLSSRITEFEYPLFFVDEMVTGAFKRFRHEHHFKDLGGKTEMLDVFEFESPFGLLGKAFNAVVLTKYMRRLLTQRNKVIKEYAESDKWTVILSK